MAGLVPAIHAGMSRRLVLWAETLSLPPYAFPQDRRVDARDKRGHDGWIGIALKDTIGVALKDNKDDTTSWEVKR
jgi:hypothetical protein